MISYILAENLKHKGTFLKKLLVIMPITLILLSLFLMPSYFTANSYNWWYVIIMPATFALIPAMMDRKESRKLNYRAVFPLNINLNWRAINTKLWIFNITICKFLTNNNQYLANPIMLFLGKKNWLYRMYCNKCSIRFRIRNLVVWRCFLDLLPIFLGN